MDTAALRSYFQAALHRHHLLSFTSRLQVDSSRIAIKSGGALPYKVFFERSPSTSGCPTTQALAYGSIQRSPESVICRANLDSINFVMELNSIGDKRDSVALTPADNFRCRMGAHIDSPAHQPVSFLPIFYYQSPNTLQGY
jgi:hypothetical protein